MNTKARKRGMSPMIPPMIIRELRSPFWPDSARRAAAFSSARMPSSPLPGCTVAPEVDVSQPVGKTTRNSTH